jgi:hypothetical protein
MLEDGTYREHREVSYYVDCLCITSKYLSEVLKKVSRYAANYWINRYTIFDISRLLSDKSLSFVQISDMFSFVTSLSQPLCTTESRFQSDGVQNINLFNQTLLMIVGSIADILLYNGTML